MRIFILNRIMFLIAISVLMLFPIHIQSVFAAQEKNVQNQVIDPLPSWNEGTAKQTIVSFVNSVTDKSSSDFVEPEGRITTFDNDGTLWVEYPMYTQALFAFDRIKTLAPQHPEWKTTQPFKAVLEGDMITVGASGMNGLMEIIIGMYS